MPRAIVVAISLILGLGACRIPDIDAKVAASRDAMQPVTLEHGGFVSIHAVHFDRVRGCFRRERQTRQALYPRNSTSWTPDDRANIEAPISSSDTFAGYERVVTRLEPLEPGRSDGRYSVTSTYFLARPRPNPVTCPVTP